MIIVADASPLVALAVCDCVLLCPKIEILRESRIYFSNSLLDYALRAVNE